MKKTSLVPFLNVNLLSDSTKRTCVQFDVQSSKLNKPSTYSLWLTYDDLRENTRLDHGIKTTFSAYKNPFYSKLVEKINKPYFLWVYRRNKMLGEHSKRWKITLLRFVIYKLYSRVLLTSRVLGYHTAKPIQSVLYCLNKSREFYCSAQ